MMSNSPSLTVIKQEAVAIDADVKNGVTRELYMVVKQQPFSLRLVAQEMDLRKMDLSAKLYYDFEQDIAPREVETLKITPIDYVCHVDENGKSMTLEVRCGVLTSAHEGAHFRVKVIAKTPDSNSTYECFSHPLKIMSKRGQILKVMKRKTQQTGSEPKPTKFSKVKTTLKRKRMDEEEAASPTSSIPESPLASESSPVPPMNTNSIAEVLQKLQEQQQQQALLIQRVLQQQQQQSSPVSLFPQTSSSPLPTFQAPMDFETSFSHFVQSYQRLTPDDRKTKMRKILKQLDSNSTESLNEIVDVYSSEGYYPMPLYSSESSCSQCPHKQQLDSLESFLTEFARDPFDINASGDLSILQTKDTAVLSKLKEILAKSNQKS